MSEKTMTKQSDIEATSQAVVDAELPKTSGYVPIVGLPDGESTAVSDLNGATTTVTFSSIEPDSPAASTGTKEKTKGCTVCFTDARQYIFSGGVWVQPSAPPYPFILNFDLNVQTSIDKDEQLQISFTNNNTVQAKLEIDYWVGTAADHVTGTATFIRG